MPTIKVDTYVFPRNEKEMRKDGWIEIENTGVFKNPNTSQYYTFYQHYCGLMGYNPMLGDSCPACDAYTKARKIENLLKINADKN